MTDRREFLAKDQLYDPVSERTVRDWLGRIDKDSKEARDRRIFDMWMACATDREIGERENLSEEGARKVTQHLADLPDVGKAASNHQTDFDPPLYNIWKQQTKTDGSSHFGNSEVRWVDNRDEAKIWIIRNQFGRRNLTPFVRAELVLVLKPLIAAKAREKQADGGAKSIGNGKVVRQKSDEPLSTKHELASVAGVSHDTEAADAHHLEATRRAVISAIGDAA